jgi:cbb3-type cytochrome oxidase maturation protein
MTIIILLIAISVSIALLFLGVFIWSLTSGQYDDTYTPSVRMLFEDNVGVAKKSDQKKSKDVSLTKK